MNSTLEASIRMGARNDGMHNICELLSANRDPKDAGGRRLNKNTIGVKANHETRDKPNSHHVHYS